MALDPETLKQAGEGITDDTAIHWLLGIISAAAAALASIIAWNGRDAMSRLKAVEDGKADKADIAAQLQQLARNQEVIQQRFDQAHRDNTTRLDGIFQMLVNSRKS